MGPGPGSGHLSTKVIHTTNKKKQLWLWTVLSSSLPARLRSDGESDPPSPRVNTLSVFHLEATQKEKVLWFSSGPRCPHKLPVFSWVMWSAPPAPCTFCVNCHGLQEERRSNSLLPTKWFPPSTVWLEQKASGLGNRLPWKQKTRLSLENILSLSFNYLLTVWRRNINSSQREREGS